MHITLEESNGVPLYGDVTQPIYTLCCNKQQVTFNQLVCTYCERQLVALRSGVVKLRDAVGLVHHVVVQGVAGAGAARQLYT